MSETLEPDRLRTLIDVGGFIVSELDVDVVLGHVLEAACELTDARYAALGVLNAERTELERFITRGIDDETERAIGELPRGRGVLGALIADPKPMRLSRVGDDPASYGFPAGHPPMNSFLGVPVFIRGQVWGNLYLTEKRERDFDLADESAIVVLARWAGIAVENARLFRVAEERRGELEYAMRGLQATQAVALALGTDIELERVLELIVKRGRALVEARTVLILLRHGDQLELAAMAGHGQRTGGAAIPVHGSTSGEAMLRGRVERFDNVAELLRDPAEQYGVEGARTALIVPLTHRGETLGVLMAFDRGVDAVPFTDEDEQALKAFAASAATAVVTAQGVQQLRVHDTIAAAEAERRRWAQELHDETLQSLGGLRVLLASARRSQDPELLASAVDQAIVQIEREIANLRAIITELRPAALDELGLEAALEALFERHRTVNDLNVTEELSLTDGDGTPVAIGSDLQATIYRVVQEALTNVVKHAGASTARVDLRADGDHVTVQIADDGHGFDVDLSSPGFGLRGMRERILVAGGDFAIDSSPAGTALTATLPLTGGAALHAGTVRPAEA